MPGDVEHPGRDATVHLIRPAGFVSPAFPDGNIRGEAIAVLMNAYGYTLEKLPRMFFKGMGNIPRNRKRSPPTFWPRPRLWWRRPPRQSRDRRARAYGLYTWR